MDDPSGWRGEEEEEEEKSAVKGIKLPLAQICGQSCSLGGIRAAILCRTADERPIVQWISELRSSFPV